MFPHLKNGRILQVLTAWHNCSWAQRELDHSLERDIVELGVELLPILSSLKLEGRNKNLVLEEFPKVKSSWQIPKQVVETRAWSDSRSKEMEPKQRGLNMGWRNRAPWKRMWKTE